MQKAAEIVRRLRAMSNPAAVAGMARFGINPQGTLGVPIPRLRALARELGRDHRLARELWSTRIHEARILASMVADPDRTSVDLMNRWAAGFDSWDVCDQVVMNLFRWTPHAYARASSWSRDKRPFVKRAAFALMAALASGDRTAAEGRFVHFLGIIRREAADERDIVKKAINWALRGIGKRTLALHARSLKLARELSRSPYPAARWVGRDAVRELSSAATLARVKKRS